MPNNDKLNSKCMYSKFSKMEWLNREIERNAVSPGRNEYSDWYYSTLEKIRESQEDGTIDDMQYALLGAWSVKAAIAYGYYTANIHYDLYQPSTDIDELEDRIISFIDITDDDVLRDGSWFTLNFLTNFKSFLVLKGYKNLEDTDLEEWIKEQGNEKEKLILQMHKRIMNKEKTKKKQKNRKGKCCD